MMNRSWLFLYLGIGFLAISGGLLVFLIVNGTPGEGGFASRAIPFIGDDSAGTQEADGDDSGERERVRNADLSPKYRVTPEELRGEIMRDRREIEELRSRVMEVRGSVVETTLKEGEGMESGFYRVGLSGSDPEEVAVYIRLRPREYRRFRELVEPQEGDVAVLRGVFRKYDKESYRVTLEKGLVIAGVSVPDIPEYIVNSDASSYPGKEIDHMQFGVELVFKEDITDLSESEIEDLLWYITAREGGGAAGIWQWNMDKSFDREVLENTHLFDLEDKNLVKHLGTYVYLKFYPEEGFRD